MMRRNKEDKFPGKLLKWKSRRESPLSGLAAGAATANKNKNDGEKNR